MRLSGKRLRIAIVGYGTGGQASALMLSRDGHDVEVFERAPLLGPVGAGFLLQPIGLAVLWEMQLLDAVLEHGVRVSRLYGETASGRPVMDMRYRDMDPRLFGLGVQRGALFGLLDAAWQQGRSIHCGATVSSVDAQRGQLTLTDGRVHTGFDLIIVADGAASKLRGQVAKASFDRPYPWGAQWCLVDQGHWPDHDELQQRYVAARHMAGMLPVGTRPGDPVPKMSFFWSVPLSVLDSNSTDPDQWREAVAAVWPQAAERLAMTEIPGGLASARYRDVLHSTWSKGRAVLLGDAAHAMSPQLGQGVNMALLDAQSLRDALRTADSIPDALDAYQHERRRHIGIYHFWSRWLTPLFQSERDVAAWGRDRIFHPMSRLPLGRGQMLPVLTGTRSGWFGKHPLHPEFLEALSKLTRAPVPALGRAASRLE